MSHAPRCACGCIPSMPSMFEMAAMRAERRRQRATEDKGYSPSTEESTKSRAEALEKLELLQKERQRLETDLQQQRQMRAAMCFPALDSPRRIMTLNEPPHGRILDATHLAATPLLESVNWLLDAVHQQHLAFGQISEDVQHLQAFKESTELCLKSMKEESAAAGDEGAAGEIAVAYTKDVVERAREASKGASREPGQGVVFELKIP
eukprot:symbB.v1.2.001621.t1/scaffold80.1/size342472/8